MIFWKHIYWVALFNVGCISQALAQQGDYYTGEVGVGLGAAHYFGDLNTTTQLNCPKPAATVFFRKNWGQYIATRVGVSFAQLGYADRYNTKNEVQWRRNLSFNTNVWEVSLQGDFNFFRFVPHEPGYNFTPYITLGAGLISYDPYTIYNNERIYFRQLPIGTEGQNSPLYPERKMYSNNALSIPFGGGFKYAIGGGRLNLTLEVLHRYTSTDYLDDVSTTYIDPAAFPKPPGGISVAQLLSDRSGEIGTPIGIPGRQRGSGSKQKDQFVTAMFIVSFNLMSYKCPVAD